MHSGPGHTDEAVRLYLGFFWRLFLVSNQFFATWGFSKVNHLLSLLMKTYRVCAEFHSSSALRNLPILICAVRSKDCSSTDQYQEPLSICIQADQEETETNKIICRSTSFSLLYSEKNSLFHTHLPWNCGFIWKLDA